MFLTWLSERDYEARFWPFLLRFETTAAGFVAAARDRFSADATDDELRDFLERCVAKCFDVESGVVPATWWDGTQIPSYRWFREYFAAETPFAVAEIRRRIAKKTEKNAATQDAAPADAQTFDDYIDREKVRNLARKSDAFREYLLRSDVVDAE